MPVSTSQQITGDQSYDAPDVDPVLLLAHARDRAITLWSEAQPQMVNETSLETCGNPTLEATALYTAAYQRAMRFLDRILEIEDQLYDTPPTMVAGLIFQAKLLRDAVFPADHDGRRRLTSIISGLEAMSIGSGSGLNDMGFLTFDGRKDRGARPTARASR
jgi:hypothetical protein